MMEDVKKKILYIDPLLQNGHVNFNNIYIESLRKSGYLLEFVFVSGYEGKLNIDSSDVVYLIPNFFFKKDLGKLGNRIAYFFALLFIKMVVDFKKYDLIIFSSFEEVSFFLSNIKKCYLINHINASTSVESKVKFFFLNKVLINNSLIVFDQETKNYLSSKGNYKIYVQPHGLPKVKSNIATNEDYEFRVILDELAKYKKVLFSPSESSSDKDFINELIQSNKFMEYLEQEDVLFVYKDKSPVIKRNTLVISRFLSQDEYDYLFLKSNVILIAYPKNFKYRVSGVLLECMANDKPCAVSRIDALESYNDFFKYGAFYSNIVELIQVITDLDEFKGNGGGYYRNLVKLEPNFNNIINKQI